MGEVTMAHDTSDTWGVGMVTGVCVCVCVCAEGMVWCVGEGRW